MERSDILNSWKEIASYLGRGVRTVQRWERDSQLPVRRPSEKNHSAVIALRSEIDQWLLATKLKGRLPSTPDDPTTALKILESRRQQLQAELRCIEGEIGRIQRRSSKQSGSVMNARYLSETKVFR